MTRASGINPSMLSWARESAGLNLEEAAKRIGLSDSSRSSRVAKLRNLEAGEVEPTHSQLAKFAAVYRRPLTFFYLKERPVAASRGEDFRSRTTARSGRDEALLDALLRDIRVRHQMVRDLLEDDEELQRRPYVGSADLSDGAASTAAAIATGLGFDPMSRSERGRFRRDFFAHLRQLAERVGVFVLLVGDLGSHHSDVAPDVFRGFAIADPVAPFVVINDNDAQGAWSFTLIHELAHIWLGQTGISNASAVDVIQGNYKEVEEFCNAVAGQLLLPDAVLLGFAPHEMDLGAVGQAVAELSETWSVTEPMVAFRLHQHGRLSAPIYRRLAVHYADRWQRHQATGRKDGGQPDYYRVRRHRLGNSLLSLVTRSLREGELTHTRAARILGVKPANVDRLVGEGRSDTSGASR